MRSEPIQIIGMNVFGWCFRSPPFVRRLYTQGDLYAPQQLRDQNEQAPRWQPTLAAGNHIDLKLRVGGWDVGGWESEFTTHDIAALRQGARLVKGDLAIAALTSEAAVVRDNQLFDRNIFQRLADFRRHVFGAVGLQRAVTYGADAEIGRASCR